MWYSRETAPELGNRFRLFLRCVRAWVRAKLRERDDSAVARLTRVGQMNLSMGLFKDVQLSLSSVLVYRSR